MKKTNFGVLSSLLLKRSNAVEFVVVTFITAFAISLIVSSATLVEGFKPYGGIYFGLSLFALVLTYFLVKIFKGLSNSEVIRGFIIRDAKENKLIKIDRYPFSKEIVKYLNAAFAENPDIKAIWEREPLRNNTLNDLVKWDKNLSKQLIHEAVEYYVIEELSYHLSSYFNNELFKEEHVQEISRNEIPEILYENRFLQLFSKPMKERAAFETVNGKEEIKETKELVIDGKKIFVTVGDTVFANGKDGARYQKFDLVLPLKTSVKRLDKHNISIETDRFTLNIKTIVDSKAKLPEGFWEYYLNRHPLEKFHNVFGIKLEINIRFKAKNFFLKNKWEYFGWIDSFLERLNSNFSLISFFEKLDWDKAYTVLQIMELNKQQGEKSIPTAIQVLQKKEPTTKKL